MGIPEDSIAQKVRREVSIFSSACGFAPPANLHRDQTDGQCPWLASGGRGRFGLYFCPNYGTRFEIKIRHLGIAPTAPSAIQAG